MHTNYLLYSYTLGTEVKKHFSLYRNCVSDKCQTDSMYTWSVTQLGFSMHNFLGKASITGGLTDYTPWAIMSAIPALPQNQKGKPEINTS